MPEGPIAAARPATARVVLWRLAIVGKVFAFLWRTGRWWLLPMMVVLVLATLLLVAVQALEYVAPFVYTLF
jgi:hypothetical protein